jgi:hypothetical protein
MEHEKGKQLMSTNTLASLTIDNERYDVPQPVADAVEDMVDELEKWRSGEKQYDGVA